MKRRPLTTFFIIAFVISWACWLMLPVAAHNNSPRAYSFLKSLGLFGPCLAAIVVVAAANGMEGIRSLLGRLLIWRVKWIWYAVALLLPAAMSLLTSGLHMLFGGAAPNFSNPPVYQIFRTGFLGEYNVWTIMVPLFLLTLVKNSSLLEEVAWRGFALPRLQRGFNAWIAAVLIGLAFFAWDLPRLVDDVGFSAKPLVAELLRGVAFSILVAWIFNNSGGSLLLTVLFTNSYKVTSLLLAMDSEVTPLALLAGQWIVVGVVLLFNKPESLTREGIPARALAEAP
jgi:membrane protease YdiL (CAAX protease family)